MLPASVPPSMRGGAAPPPRPATPPPNGIYGAAAIQRLDESRNRSRLPVLFTSALWRRVAMASG